MLHLPHLISCYTEGWSHPLRSEQQHCSLAVCYFFLSCRLMLAVLSRPSFRILRTEVSQDLTSIWWMSRAMNDKSWFGYILWMIYIPFSVLYSTLTNIGVSSWWGESSYYFPGVTRTVGIFPSRFFIRRFYNTFINIFWYFHAFKKKQLIWR